MPYPAESLPWFYLADATCLCQTDTYGLVPKLVDPASRTDLLKKLIVPRAHPGADHPPLIETVKTIADSRFEDQPNEWPDDHPWPDRFALGIHRMPDDVPSNEVVLGPDKVVLPWPFPADEKDDLKEIAEDELELSFPKVERVPPGKGTGKTKEFDPATDVYLDAMMYAVDHLLTKDRDWLDGAGEGAATNQGYVRDTIEDCVKDNCSGRGPASADSGYFSLPERMWFTIDPNRITDHTYFSVWEDGAGASMLHLMMGKQERLIGKQERQSVFDIWSCRDQD